MNIVPWAGSAIFPAAPRASRTPCQRGIDRVAPDLRQTHSIRSYLIIFRIQDMIKYERI